MYNLKLLFKEFLTSEDERRELQEISAAKLIPVAGIQYTLSNLVYFYTLKKVYFICTSSILLVYSGGSSPNGHSRKRTALLTAAFTKPCLSQLPCKLFIFHSCKRPAPITNTFFAPEGVCLRELPLYLTKVQLKYSTFGHLKSILFG